MAQTWLITDCIFMFLQLNPAAIPRSRSRE
ncbi:hypothetical protein CCACVL1_14964 [Corchorus capsularis]|uniref:Uncharacterized protein n=1 Tax=Corchorus capsularis TaxID=210143 RepID=A0A1R3I4V7_COCAP|nr:hypothetical protein CCACVL1_14964 [Corchorus capsularis]